jgi:hypothetical protein
MWCDRLIGLYSHSFAHLGSILIMAHIIIDLTKQYPDIDLTKDPDIDLTKDPDMCPICKDEISYSDMSSTGCGHYACFECIELWLDRSSTCPLCRREASTLVRVHKNAYHEEEVVFMSVPVKRIKYGPEHWGENAIFD